MATAEAAQRVQNGLNGAICFEKFAFLKIKHQSNENSLGKSFLQLRPSKFSSWLNAVHQSQ